MTVEAAAAASGLAPRLIACPYKGLPFYDDTDEDASLFFGRVEMRKLIVANLKASRLTLLYGPSGVGKSSLLHAGVAHSLRVEAAENLADFGAPGHAVVVFRSWDGDPVKRLADAVAETVRGAMPAVSDEPEFDADATLTDILAGWSRAAGGRLLIVLDQFEDYFRHHSDHTDGRSFGLQFQLAVVHPGLQANFLVGIREDAYAQLNRFTRVPGLFDNALRLGHLTPDGAVEAIDGPLEVYRSSATPVGPVRAEPALVTTLLHELARDVADGAPSANGDGTRYEALSLQLVLHRLWHEEHRAGSTTMRATTLKKLGGTKTIVRDHLRAALEGLGQRDRDVAARILLNLATLEGKVAVEAETLAADVPPRSRPRVQRVLDRLEASRIVLLDQSGPPRYEILHDSLAREARDWAREHEYARERRRRSQLAAGVVAVVVAALAIAGTAYWSTALNSRQNKLDLSESNLYATQANAAQDPQRSLELALRAEDRARSGAALDALVRALLRPRPLALLGGRSPITTATFSPDGRLLMSAAADGTATIWDMSTRRRIAELAAGSRPLLDAAFSPGGRLVATAGADGIVRIWRARGGAPLETLRGHVGRVLSLAFSPDGSELVTGGADNTARLWRTRDGTLRLIFQGHRGPVTRVAFGDHGRTVLTASADGAAKLWSVPERRRLRTLPRAEGPLVDAVFSPRGDLVATGDATGRARVFRVRDGAALVDVQMPGRLTDLAFAPDGRALATASASGIARLWRVPSGQRIATLAGHTGSVLAVAFSPDGALVATASADGTARLWTTGGRSAGILPGHRGGVVRAVFSPDSNLVATAGTDGTVQLWPAHGAGVVVLRGSTGAIVDATFSPDGRLVATAGVDGAARLWHARGGAPLAVLRAGRDPVRRVLFDRDGKLLLAADLDGTARVWSVPGARPVSVFRDGNPILDAAWNPDGSLVATAGSDGRVSLWRVGGGRSVTLGGHTGPVLALAFSPDGRLVASASADGTGRVWSARDGRLVAVLHGSSQPLSTVEFSPDGRLVLVSGHDGAARLFRAPDWTPVATLRADRLPLVAASFSPDGALVVTAGADGAHVWRTAHTDRVVSLPGSAGAIRAAVFGPNRWLPLLVTAGVDGNVRVWSAAGGPVLATFGAPGSRATTASFSPDGTRVIGGFEDGTTRIYRCEGCGAASLRALLADARRVVASP